MMLAKNHGVLGEKALLFLLDYRHLDLLLLLLLLAFCLLDLSLSVIDGQSLLPESLDLAFVL